VTKSDCETVVAAEIEEASAAIPIGEVFMTVVFSFPGPSSEPLYMDVNIVPVLLIVPPSCSFSALDFHLENFFFIFLRDLSLEWY